MKHLTEREALFVTSTIEAMNKITEDRIARIKELETENETLKWDLQNQATENQQYKELIEDFKTHIDSGLIDLSSSGYLRKDIENTLNSAAK
jgi:uncharacterized protein with von Willebrand factor type A (vWA) domain